MKYAIAIVAVIVVALGLVYFVDVDQTQEAALPEVSVEGGQLPGYDVETGDVEIGSTETTVEVPNVDISTSEEIVTLPTIDIESPEEDNRTAENE